MSRIKSVRWIVVAIALSSVALMGQRCRGLDPAALLELEEVGLFKYVGQFEPAVSEEIGEGWTKHTFDTDGGEGPICIAGTPFSAFTKEKDPSKVLVFLQGGGACWQDFYFCNVLAEDQEPPPAQVGIWDESNPDNPFKDHSIVYMPYCDGSVHTGDNDVVDPSFPFGPVRFHRGLRNQTAGMDLGAAMFPDAEEITVAGSSAGGVGATGNAAGLIRRLWGNFVDLTIFNDAGPVAVNLDDVAGIAAREADWQFAQFYPPSCTECDPFAQPTAIIKWRLENDYTVREAFYETDGDGTNRFFLAVPTQEQYREIVLDNHIPIHEQYPARYRIFLKSGDDSHTALQTPLFYSQEVHGVTLDEWTAAFLVPRKPWLNLVESFVPLP